jgi:hypothetical protein
MLTDLVPTPLDEPSGTYLYWDRPAIQKTLRDYWFIEAFGGYKQAGGYSPGYETNPTTGAATDHVVTGLLDIDTSTDYALDEEPKMYIAIWVNGSTDVKVKGQIYLLPNE